MSERADGDFVRACAVDDVPAEGVLAVDVEGTDVAIIRTAGEVFAILDECSHASIALSEGEVEDCQIECWLHGSRFDLRTGRPTGLPATEPVPVYTCRVVGDDITIDLRHPRNTHELHSAPDTALTTMEKS